MNSILDPSFRYTSSVATDLRKTLARIRCESRERERAKAKAEKDAASRALRIRLALATGVLSLRQE